MKKLFAILLCSLGLLAVACYDPPPEPTCPLPGNPDATETVTPAVWHDATDAVYSACEAKIFEASRTYCPTDDSAFTSTDNRKGCAKHVGEPGHKVWRYADPIHETFGPITVVYGEKSSDPNHCHRPTGSSLGVPSWAMSSFDKLPEKLDRTLVTPARDGYWDDPACAAPDAPPVLCEDEAALNNGQEGECQYPEPTPPPEVCKPIGYMWYQCNTGNWTYTPGGSADKCWCGGLNGSRVVKESYDCGRHWTYYLDGERTTQDFSWLGFYKAPACAIGGC